MADRTTSEVGGRAERRRRPPLRVRTIAAFGLTALVLSSTLAVLAYALVRHSLVRDRESAALDQAYTNARLVRTALRQPDADPAELIAGVRVFGGGDALLRLGAEWYTSSIDADRRALPDGLVGAVTAGSAGRQTTVVSGEPSVVVGVPVVEADAGYFEVVPLGDVEDTIGVLGSSLAAAAAAATIAGVVVGASLTGAVLRPVRRVSVVARRIVDGDLETRLQASGDADLDPFVSSFNEMLDDLRDRIDREARFASDVAHEVRGPLAALGAAVDVVNRRRAELPESVTVALDALESQVRSFNQLVLELLEISRFDSGAASLVREPVDLVAFAEQVVDEVVGGGVRVLGPPAVEVPVDRRRLHQVLANLLVNAANYGGGATAVRILDGDAEVTVAVDDAGPGVAQEERDRVFARFARGEAGERPGAPKGSGLGLALVAEHVALHGGRVWVEESPDGGARFAVALPKGGDG